MDRSNKLLTSLKQDLKTLNNTSSEITKKTNVFQLNSWLFPSKTYNDFLDISLLLNSPSKDKEYLSYLEFIIDKLYLIINLFIKFIESNIKTEPSFKNVKRPNNLSLGGSVNLLWKKMLDLSEFINENKINATHKTKSNIHNTKLTQTLEYSPEICNSCCASISCMKSVVNELESCIHAPEIKLIRKEIKEDIFDLTQHGCMKRLTKAILEDFKSIVKHTEVLEESNLEWAGKMRDLNKKYLESLDVLKSTESLSKKVQKKCKIVQSKNKQFLKRNSELVGINTEKNYELSEAKSKLQILGKSSAESTISLALFSTNNDRLQQEIQRTLSDNINVLNEKNMWKRRFSDVYLENRELKSRLEKTTNDVESLTKIMNNISEDCLKLNTKLDGNDARMAKRTEIFENLLKSTQDNLNGNNAFQEISALDKKMLETFVPEFKITGEPAADMKHQIEINNINIHRIQQHNAELGRTIKRLEEKNFFYKFM